MSRLYTTRIWVFHEGHAEQARTLLDELQRLAERLPGVDICLYQDHTSPERFVTFSEWPDRQAILAFRNHPQVERIRTALLPLISETYPPDGALELQEVRS